MVIIGIIYIVLAINTNYCPLRQQAVIRVTLMEADDLKRADAGKIFGKGKSDPYCKISGPPSKIGRILVTSRCDLKWPD